MVPVPARSVKQWGPSMVFEKRMPPVPAPVSQITSCVNVMGPAQLMESFVVVTLPPKETLPPPDSVKLPSVDRDALIVISPV
jgi:hypothetical protein